MNYQGQGYIPSPENNYQRSHPTHPNQNGNYAPFPRNPTPFEREQTPNEQARYYSAEAEIREGGDGLTDLDAEGEEDMDAEGDLDEERSYELS